jgi:lipopolysaccharide transport protein LptA
MVSILLRKERRVNKKIFILGALATALLPGAAVANQEFKVSPSTGLELDEPATGAPVSRVKSVGAPVAAEKKPTEITASKETTFDEKARVAVFTGDVTVVDSQFNLRCEKLTAYLKKAKGVEAKGDAEPDAGGGLDRVVAEGDVLIVQEKVGTNGEVTRYVGKAKKAEYNAATGDVTLTGWPQIQQGINNQVATEEGTIMILNKSGRLRTVGPSKTEIKESSDKDLLKAAKQNPARDAQTP